MPYFLTAEDVKDICYDYAQAHLTYDEPLPSFESKYIDKLETALASPQVSIGGILAYSTLPQQAAVLFYEMIKLHPFFNGNKRIACVALTTFLYMNGKWLSIGWKELYDIAVTVATSRTENREGMLRLLTDFINHNIVKK